MLKVLKTKRGTEILKLTPARCNIFFVRGNGHIIMVDTGMPSDRLLISRTIKKRNLIPEAVILTHTHFDHAANAAWMKREYGAKVLVHSAEAASLSQGNTPIPAGAFPLTKGLVSIGRKLPSLFTFEPCSPDIVINEKFDLSYFGLEGYIMHVPGHCQGEIAIVIENEIVFAGDDLMGVIPGKIFPAFADNINDLINSWKTLLDTNCKIILPGHGRPVKIETLSREYNRRKLSFPLMKK